jgi:hypothetical protein
MVLIGSRRMVELFDIRRDVTNSDWDYLTTVPVEKSGKVEIHLDPLLYYLYTKYPDERVMLFTLKASHFPFHRHHLKKTLYDLHQMQKTGVKLDESLFYILYYYWEGKFGKPWRADFTKDSAEFFDDAVSRESLHDDLHELSKGFDMPAFRYLQDPAQTTVYVDRDKFFEATEELRQRVVIEEAQTLALERYASKGIGTPQIIYSEFISGLIERLAPLWMAPYIINNLDFFLTYKDEKYNENFRRIRASA